MPVAPQTYGLLAEFASVDDLLKAIRQVRAAGYSCLDAFAPYPLKEAAEALGFRRTVVPLVMLLGGLIGCSGAFLMQYWTAVYDYPINVGGRPLDSWPSFIPITFELTVLTSALVGFFGLLALCGLPMLYHPVFNVPAFARASRDRFFLCVDATDPQYDPEGTRRLLETLLPITLEEVPT